MITQRLLDRPLATIRPIQIAMVLSGCWLAWYLGQHSAWADYLGIVLVLIGAFSAIVLLNPRLGLYAFLFTLVLVPFDFRVLKLSPNTMVVCASGVAVAAAIAFGRQRPRFSTLYVPAAIAVLVTWLNFVRYGAVTTCAVCGFNTAWILTEAFVLFVLTVHLVHGGTDVRHLAIALILATIIRNSIDIVMTLQSIAAGDTLGAIRHDDLYTRGAVTAESGWRSMLLPILVSLILNIRSRGFQLLASAALILNLTWLSLSGARIAFLGMTLSVLVLMIVLDPRARMALLRFIPPLIALVALVSGFLTSSWSHVFETTAYELELGSEYGRMSSWSDAFAAFLQNPLWGSSVGPSHSFFFGTARYMGLAFLVPFGLTLWLVWRRGAWLRQQRTDEATYGFVVGLQGALLVTLGLNVVDTMFQGAVAAFLFWMFVGVQEGIYHARNKRTASETVALAPASVAKGG